MFIVFIDNEKKKNLDFKHSFLLPMKDSSETYRDGWPDLLKRQ